MENLFVTYEQALALKQIGFDEPCLAYYSCSFFMDTEDSPTFKMWEILSTLKENKNSFIFFLKNDCTAPIKQQVFKWGREKHNLHHKIMSHGDWDNLQYQYIISGTNIPESCHMYFFVDANSYEQAESACIDEIIKIIQNKK